MNIQTAVSGTVVRAYGMRELRTQYNRNTMLGLMAAALIHIAFVAGCYIAQRFAPGEKNIVVLRPKSLDFITQPSIFESAKEFGVQIAVRGAHASIGIPIPVPDFDISAEKTIATQQELGFGLIEASGSGVGTPPTGIVGEPGTDEIAISDPAPDDFLVVEVPPVPVKQIVPAYPEIARRAGVEGTVWVKALITKEGKVKKVIVLKSDADIFNEAATDAAMHYVFTPAIMNSGPVAVWASIPFRFKLNR